MECPSILPQDPKLRYGGLTGHFLFINFSMARQLKKSGYRVGTGQVASVNCMKRELNRGIDWIFTNHALKLQLYLNKTVSQKQFEVIL